MVFPPVWRGREGVYASITGGVGSAGRAGQGVGRETGARLRGGPRRWGGAPRPFLAIPKIHFARRGRHSPKLGRRSARPQFAICAVTAGTPGLAAGVDRGGDCGMILFADEGRGPGVMEARAAGWKGPDGRWSKRLSRYEGGLRRHAQGDVAAGRSGALHRPSLLRGWARSFVAPSHNRGREPTGRWLLPPSAEMATRMFTTSTPYIAEGGPARAGVGRFEGGIWALTPIAGERAVLQLSSGATHSQGSRIMAGLLSVISETEPLDAKPVLTGWAARDHLKPDPCLNCISAPG